MSLIFKVKLLDKKELKKNCMFKVAMCKGKDVELRELYVDMKYSKVLAGLNDGEFHSITKIFVNRYDALWASKDTKVYKCEPFQCDEVEKQFYNAEKVTLSVANDSPLKKRLAVEGVVEKITDSGKPGEWKRQDIVISDNVTQSTVKLWNMEPLDATYLKKSVVIRNLEINHYKGQREIASTKQSEVKLLDAVVETKDVTIVGKDLDTQPCTVLCEDGSNNIEEYYVEKLLLENVSQSAVTIKEIEAQDPSAMVVTSIHGQSYQCIFPNTQEEEEKEKQDEQEAMEMGVTELLRPLSDGPCLVHTKGWWTYELCYSDTIKQFHLEDSQIAGDVVKLGVYESDYDWSQEEDKPRKKNNAKTKYHSQQYVNGSLCDLTNKLRKAEVRYACEEGAGDYITRIDEPETCVYVITVHTSRLCRHPYLKPAIAKQPVPITCSPLLNAEEYEEYMEFSAEEHKEDDSLNQKKKVENLDEEFSLQNGKLVKIEEQKEDDVTEISDEVLTRVMSEALQKALSDVLGDGMLGDNANGGVDIDMHLFEDVDEMQKNLEKMIKDFEEKLKEGDETSELSADDSADDDVDDDVISDEIDDDEEDVIVESEDEDAELLDEFDRELDNLNNREKVAKFRDNINSAMNSKFTEILEEAEQELEVDGDEMNKNEVLHQLGKTLDKLLHRLDKAEKKLQNADTMLAEKIEEQQAKINNLKHELANDLVEEEITDETTEASNEQSTLNLEKSKTADSEKSKSLKFTSSLKEGPREDIQSKEDSSGTSTQTQQKDTETSETYKNVVATKVHENKGSSDKISDTGQNIEIKVITSGYIDKDGSLHMLDDDDNSNINQMIVAILGRGGAEDKETQRQKQLEDGYNFQWNKKQKQDKKQSTVIP